MVEIDIKENRLSKIDKELLLILLKDRTTKKNLIWATDIYSHRGKQYLFNECITPELITGYYGNLIRPRVQKSIVEMKKRVKINGEVFTPSWVCNIQNNLIDEQWFDKKGVFNRETEKSWVTNFDKIIFEAFNKSWIDYVKSNRLEISCGEAPYITSRYDTVSGKYIETNNRIGFLDRKLRIITENTIDKNEWIAYAKEAMKSTYGYDWQGDNVLLARENVLFTIIEHYEYKFNDSMEAKEILEFAEIISWNIWQMDGIKFVVPNSCVEKKEVQMNLFGEEEVIIVCEGCRKNNQRLHNGQYSKIKDWDKNKTIRFIDLIGG